MNELKLKNEFEVPIPVFNVVGNYYLFLFSMIFFPMEKVLKIPNDRLPNKLLKHVYLVGLSTYLLDQACHPQCLLSR